MFRVANGHQARDFIKLEFSSKTGREAYASSENSEPYLRDTYGVGVAIVHDNNEPGGFRIQSAYPRQE